MFDPFFYQSLDCILLVDVVSGNVIGVNPAVYQTLGYTEAEVRGKAFSSLFPKSQEALSPGEAKQTMVDGSVFEAQPILHKNGSVRPMDISAQILDFADRKVILVTLRDISEFIELGRRFRSMFETPLMGICLFSEAGFHYVNQQMAKTFGYLTREFESLKLSNLLLEEADVKAVEGVMSGSQPFYRGLIRGSNKAGQTVFLEAYCAHVTYRQKNALIAMLLDNTAVYHLQTEQQQLKLALERVPDAFALTDSNGEIQFSNTAFRALQRLTERNFGVTNLRAFEETSVRGENFVEIWEFLQKGKQWKGYFRFPRQDGSFLVVETRAFPLFNDKLEIINYVIIERDTTREIELEEQIRHAQRQETLASIAGGVAHDLNNILSIIRTYSELIQSSIGSDSKLGSEVGEIVHASERAYSIVKDLLVLGRGAREQERYEAIDLAAVTRDALRTIIPNLPSSIHLEQALDTAQACHIWGDSSQIRQVLHNLCRNAIEAMHDHGGTITVTVKRVHISSDAECCNLELGGSELTPGEWVLLEVGDTGHGIDSKHVKRIFDPFFTTKIPASGAGVGLSVVRGILVNHGAVLGVDSTPGISTTFRVYFAWRQHQAPPSLPSSEGFETGSGRILLVDDEKSLLTVYEKLLTRQGYETFSAANGDIAWELFQHEPESYDLVLTDQAMPGLTGTELSAKILALRPNMPILLVTAYNELINNEQAIRLGIRRILYKPFKPSELNRMICDILADNK